MTRQDDDATRALLDQEPFLRIYETNLVGLSLADLSGRFLHANDETLRIIGYDRSELEAGKIDWRVLTPSEHLNKDLVAIQQMQATGHCAPFEKEYTRKDGSRVPVLVAFSIVKGELAFGTIVDLTSQREMRQQVSNLATPALTASVLDAIHDTNNHLTRILMNLELALAATQDQRIWQYLSQIMQATNAVIAVNRRLVGEMRRSVPSHSC